MGSMTTAAGSPSTGASSWLLRADRNFRFFGKVTLALLLATAGLIAADVDAWRVLFAFAHLAALVALLPLGVTLIAHAFREARAEGDPGLSLVTGVLRRHRFVAILLGVVLVAVVLSLVNFEGGSRLVRRTANLTTVGIALVLVWRYLMWSRDALRR